MSDNSPPGWNNAFLLEANPSGAESDSKAPKDVETQLKNVPGWKVYVFDLPNQAARST
jgi:hypothetical protein